MRDKLLELFNQKDAMFTYKSIKRSLSAGKKKINDELDKVLYELELEGILYEDDDSVFRSVPSNFFVTEIKCSKKGMKYVDISDNRYYIDDCDLNGALPFDIVLVSTEKKKARIVKVIKRNFSNLVCEVYLDDNVKKLRVLNTNTNIDVICGSMAMKKLKVGDVALFNVLNTKFEGKYDLEFVKVIGKITDKDILYDIVAYSNNFYNKFSDEAMREANSFSKEISEEEISKRLDLRNLTTFTIDESTCLDMDDAISITKDDKGYTLYVHIAHVSHYIKIGSALFNEALSRCTSLYYNNKVMPMLPEVISNGICSLNENEDKLTRSVIMKFDLDGNLVDYNIAKTVIRSDKKMDYSSVERLFHGEIIPSYLPYINELSLLVELDSKIISNNCNMFNIVGGEEDNIHCSSHNLIRDFMVMANHLVALYMIGKPYIYRNHPAPSYNKIKETLSVISDMGHNIHNYSNLDTAMIFNRIISCAEDGNELILLSNIILSNLKNAYYSTNNEGHFSLGLEDGYCHFTSPDRRISDLANGNLLDMYEDNNLNEENLNELMTFLNSAALRASRMERMADRCQCELESISVLENIKECIGKTLEAYIEEIHEDFIVIRSKGINNGIIRMRDMSSNNFKLLPSGKLKNLDNSKVYKVGHKLEVELIDVSFTSRLIYFKELSNLTLEEVDEVKLKKTIQE